MKMTQASRKDPDSSSFLSKRRVVVYVFNHAEELGGVGNHLRARFAYSPDATARAARWA
jgi:hypothetical protein